MSVHRPIVALIAVLAVATAGAPSATSADTGWKQKVGVRVLVDTADGKSASFLVVLVSRADVSQAGSLPTKLTKGRFVFDTLRAHSDRTQGPIRTLLDRLGVAYKTHWVVNVISVVRGNRDLVRTLASRSDVARIEPNDWVRSAVLPTEPA